MEQDASLLKIVHQETYKGHYLIANLTRFGGLYVAARNPNGDRMFVGDNILDARAAVDREA